VSSIDYVHVSADGASYIYSVRRITSRLASVTGLR